MRNFLCGCPDPIYIKYGNKIEKERPKMLSKFFGSSDFKRDLKKEQACIIFKKEMKKEQKIIQKINNKKLKRELEELYYDIEKKMSRDDELILIWNPSEKEKRSFEEVLLHEFIHITIKDEGIMIKQWKWNEGLVTYLTYFALGDQHKFEKKPKKVKGKMWSTYMEYAHKWAIILKNIEEPSSRRKIIVRKTREINIKK